MSPIPTCPPYNAKATSNPPTIANPPLAMLATAAFVGTAATLDVEEGLDPVGAPALRVDVKVVERVRLELGDGKVELGVGKVELVFALVDVVMTVTVEEGTEEVVVDTV